jgi:patatin-like phospholipase/acyl hydrolase
MASQGASDREAKALRVARQVIDDHRLKNLIQEVQVEGAADASGQDALYVWLVVADDQRPAAETVKGLTDIATAIRDRLLEHATSPWPYVSFKSAA